MSKHSEKERVINKQIRHIAGGDSPYKDGRYYYAIGFHEEDTLYLVSDSPIKICQEDGIETGESF